MADIDALIARVADDMLADEAGLAELLDKRIFAAAPVLAADATLEAETAASTRANIRRWLTAVRVHPDQQIGGEPPPEALDLALSLTRRGMDTGALLTAYRSGQNAAWGRWMQLAAERIDDRADLVAVLERSTASMNAYVDRVLDSLLTQVQQERATMLADEPSRRAETLRAILDAGAALPSEERAGARLGWELARPHTAFVIWSATGEAATALLEEAAASISNAAGCGRPLTMPAGGGTLWGWMSGGVPDRELMREAIDAADPRLLVALGPTREGMEGFRRSHAAALDAQRIVAEGGPPEGSRLIGWEAVQVVALAGHDAEAAREFVAAVLGPLAEGDASTGRLRETARVYLEEGSNAPRAAKRLHLHRNTVLYRVGRAEELLGHPLAERRLAVMLALELVRQG
jgi:DNA-binding PucR family transcriptional regulator